MLNGPVVGDLVRMRALPDGVAPAQVVAVWESDVLLVVFGPGAAAEPALLVETMDVRFETGDWQVADNADVPDAVRAPRFAAPVGAGGDVWVQDFEYNFLRPATAEDLPTLRSRVSYSPAAVEDAIAALYAAADWDPFYDPMRL